MVDFNQALTSTEAILAGGSWKRKEIYWLESRQPTMIMKQAPQ